MEPESGESRRAGKEKTQQARVKFAKVVTAAVSAAVEGARLAARSCANIFHPRLPFRQLPPGETPPPPLMRLRYETD